jgi:hypothetical protein
MECVTENLNLTCPLHASSFYMLIGNAGNNHLKLYNTYCMISDNPLVEDAAGSDKETNLDPDSFLLRKDNFKGFKIIKIAVSNLNKL